MKRRKFVALLGGAVVAAPFAARAQQHQNTRPRIGIIDDSPMWNPFRDAMQEAGYVDRRTATFEYRRADGNPERLVAATRELAALPVDVIVTFGSTATPVSKPLRPSASFGKYKMQTSAIAHDPVPFTGECSSDQSPI